MIIIFIFVIIIIILLLSFFIQFLHKELILVLLTSWNNFRSTFCLRNHIISVIALALIRSRSGKCTYSTIASPHDHDHDHLRHHHYHHRCYISVHYFSQLSSSLLYTSPKAAQTPKHSLILILHAKHHVKTHLQWTSINSTNYMNPPGYVALSNCSTNNTFMIYSWYAITCFSHSKLLNIHIFMHWKVMQNRLVFYLIVSYS